VFYPGILFYFIMEIDVKPYSADFSYFRSFAYASHDFHLTVTYGVMALVFRRA